MGPVAGDKTLLARRDGIRLESPDAELGAGTAVLPARRSVSGVDSGDRVFGEEDGARGAAGDVEEAVNILHPRLPCSEGCGVGGELGGIDSGCRGLRDRGGIGVRASQREVGDAEAGHKADCWQDCDGSRTEAAEGVAEKGAEPPLP